MAVAAADTGCGIAAPDLPHVFERFFQGKVAGGNGHGGTGLGLAIAKRILELHGSEIRVASSPGIGTVFRFSLPVWSPQP